LVGLDRCTARTLQIGVDYSGGGCPGLGVITWPTKRTDEVIARLGGVSTMEIGCAATCLELRGQIGDVVHWGKVVEKVQGLRS